MAVEEEKSKKWTREEIEKISEKIFDKRFDERIKKYLSENKNDDSQKIKELESELESVKDELEESKSELESIKSELEKSKSELESAKDELEESKSKLESAKKQLSDYEKYFKDIFALYKKSCEVLEEYKDKVKISLEDPVSFIASISNEKNLNSYYDYISYELSSLKPQVTDLFNEFVEIMCRMNPEYSLIDNNCQLDDNFHIEKNKKHTGMIDKVIIKGYKYTVSGKTVKKSLVEVL
ncbi:MAG: hypothetical protein MRZ46_00085 [Oscillospiraceae bacterium]|nr:hypothetical protein [Oscillospiraceae bacterium]